MSSRSSHGSVLLHSTSQSSPAHSDAIFISRHSKLALVPGPNLSRASRDFQFYMVAQECTPTSRPQRDRPCSALCPQCFRSLSALFPQHLRSVTALSLVPALFPRSFRTVPAAFPHCFRSSRIFSASACHQP